MCDLGPADLEYVVQGFRQHAATKVRTLYKNNAIEQNHVASKNVKIVIRNIRGLADNLLAVLRGDGHF